MPIKKTMVRITKLFDLRFGIKCDVCYTTSAMLSSSRVTKVSLMDPHFLAQIAIVGVRIRRMLFFSFFFPLFIPPTLITIFSFSIRDKVKKKKKLKKKEE